MIKSILIVILLTGILLLGYYAGYRAVPRLMISYESDVGGMVKQKVIVSYSGYDLYYIIEILKARTPESNIFKLAKYE